MFITGGGRKTPIAGTMPARCTIQRAFSKLQARLSLHSFPLPSNGRSCPRQVLFFCKLKSDGCGETKDGLGQPQPGDKRRLAATAASLSLGHAADVRFRRVRGVVGGQYLAIGSHDRKAAGEWMSTVFGSFCTRRLARVSASLAGSILQVYRGEKRVSWAGLTIGLLQTVYYCGDPRRAIAARLPASYATHRVIS